MKKIALATAVFTVTSLFIGCGGSSSDKGGTTTVLDLKGESTALAPNPRVGFENISNTGTTPKMQQKSDGVEQCSSGTKETKNYTNAYDIIYKDCKEDGVSQNGTYTYYYPDEDGFSSEAYVDFTYIDNYRDYPDSKIEVKELLFSGGKLEYVGNVEYTNGDLSFYKEGKRIEYLEYKNLIYAENKETKTYVIKGAVKDVFECFSQNYIYEMNLENMDTWLVENDNNPDFWKSGTITINGLKYVYEGESVISLSEGECVI